MQVRPFSPLRAPVRLLVLLLLLLCGAAPALAQGTMPTPMAAANADDIRVLDTARSQLDGILAALRRDSLDDAALHTLRGQVDPIQASLQEVIARLAPRVDDVKARLAQLGPKPDDKAPPEAATVTADREAQQQLLNGVDEVLKRARLLSLQVDQVGDTIASRRKDAFLKGLLERTRGVFAPTLWRDAAEDFPREVRALRTVGGDFLSRAGSNLEGWRLPLFLALLALLFALALPILRLARRVLHREPAVADPGPLRKVLGACWSALVVGTLPVALTALTVVLTDAFDLFSDRLQPLQGAIAAGIMRVAIVAALTRGILAPDRVSWRLLPVTDAAADRLRRLLVGVAAVVSVMRVVEVLSDIIVSSLSTTVLARGVGAIVVSLIVAGSLFGLPQEAEGDDCLGPRVDGQRDWFGLIRLGGWLIALTIFATGAIGYVAFGAFIAEQIVWISAIVLAAFLLLQLSVDAVDAQFRPDAMAGRLLATGVGLRRDRLGQIGIVLSGALRVIVFVVAALLIVAPWGIQSDNLSGTLRAAYFGFTVGGVTVSPSSLVTGIVLFAIGVTATRAFQAWLGERFLPSTALDGGLRNSISTVAGYIGFTIALALALAQFGLSFDKLAIVAGALSVGIGFGLQSVVNNFVSGLILLWERAIRVGDWIVVGTDQGYVRRITVRSTEIETFERATMIVPNSTLVTGTVKNWVRSDKIGRLKVEVSVQHGSDPEAVRDALLAVARDNESVIRLPAPSVLFTGLSAGGLAFELVCFVADVEGAQRTKSDLHFAMFRRFTADGIHISPPPPGPTTIKLAPDDRDLLSGTLRSAAE